MGFAAKVAKPNQVMLTIYIDVIHSLTFLKYFSYAIEMFLPFTICDSPAQNQSHLSKKKSSS